MVSQFTLDPMHLIYLGLVRKILNSIVKGEIVGYKLTGENIELFNSKLLKYITNIPVDFVRKPRPIEDLGMWKATELRQFVLYTGIVVLKDIINHEIYSHFLLLHSAYRLISQTNAKSIVTVANQVLAAFVKIFPIEAASFKYMKLSYNNKYVLIPLLHESGIL